VGAAYAADSDVPSSSTNSSNASAVVNSDSSSPQSHSNSGSVSKELADMYKQDQAGRKAAKIDWKVLGAADKQRQQRVIELLNQSKIKTARDYYNAAMVMQHGDNPDDFALAHILACVSAQKGYRPARWLSAASFDRMMQRNKHAQIFGTQFLGTANGNERGWTMDPINSDLIPDSVRTEFGVPAISKNRERMKTLDK
jgi:hypothetical protein